MNLLCVTLLSLASCAGFGAPVQLADGLYVLPGAVNTGVLVHDGSAILFDACDSVTLERLAAIGVHSVEAVYFTQFRRPNTAGGPALARAGAKLYAPEQEREYFEKADTYWADWRNRWHLYNSRPGLQVPAQSIPLAGVVKGGDTFDWNGHTITVLDTPGMTDGAVSYLVTAGEQKFCFCGDVVYGPGQIWEVYSLQKKFNGVGDYHGFLGARAALLESVGKIQAAAPGMLVPSHGQPFAHAVGAFDTLRQRMDALWRNYAAITALNHYFPDACKDVADDPQRMEPAKTFDFPGWVRKVAYTSFAVVSDSGGLLLIDCGQDSVMDKLDEWAKKDDLALEACWVTHYHDDHADALQRMPNRKRPIYCDASMAPILEHPNDYYLPCIAPTPLPVARATRDGESWTWREYTLSAFHFPGQTLYHGGLLVEGHGKKVFFAGDSLAPTGIDDYCAGNRVLLGPGLGLRRCFDILRQTRPDYIFNQHQGKAFVFSAEQLDAMEAVLAKREEIIESMVPWTNANFAVDEHWLRVYPYDQEVTPGDTFTLAMECTNHGQEAAPLEAEAVLPEGWSCAGPPRAEAVIPANTCGLRGAGVEHPDGVVLLRITCPENARPGLHVIPVRVTWKGRYLGQVRHGLVRVRGE